MRVKATLENGGTFLTATKIKKCVKKKAVCVINLDILLTSL